MLTEKLDRNFFIKQKADQAGNDIKHMLSMTVIERLSLGWRLSCRAYQLDPDEKHKLDRSLFKKGKLYV